MFSAALNVQRNQIKPPGSGRTEKEIPHVIDHPRVDSLGTLNGKSTKNRIRSQFFKPFRLEKGILQGQRISPHGSVLVDQLQIGGKHRVAHPKRSSGKHV